MAKSKSKRPRPKKFQPTLIPKPVTSQELFARDDMSLVEVVKICEADPGCGFKLRDAASADFFFLDAYWHNQDGTHWVMAAHGNSGWMSTLGIWDASRLTWQLVDLSKDTKLKKMLKKYYVGQTVKTRQRCSYFLDQELKAKYL